jgi:ATP-dependent Clp protease ATP-binding subunit ClpB
MPASKDRLAAAREGTRRSRGAARRADAALAGREGQARQAQKLKEELDAARNDLEQAQRKGEYQKAGELAYGVIPELEKKLKDAEAIRMAAASPNNPDGEEAVTADHIARSSRAGPASRSTRC